MTPTPQPIAKQKTTTRSGWGAALATLLLLSLGTPGTLGAEIAPGAPPLWTGTNAHQIALLQEAERAARATDATASLTSWLGPVVIQHTRAVEASQPTQRQDPSPTLMALQWADHVRQRAHLLQDSSFRQALHEALDLRDAATNQTDLPGELAATAPGTVLEAHDLLAAWNEPTADQTRLMAAALEFQPRPQALLAVPPLTPEPSLTEAVTAFLALHGRGPLDPAQHTWLASIPEPTATGLTRVVEAALLLHVTTQLAYGGPTPDLGLLSAARDLAAIHIAQSLPLLQVASGSIRLSPVLAFSLGTESQQYDDDYAVLVDLGGDDIYRNNGGASFGAAKNAPLPPTLEVERAVLDETHPSSALLIDTAGDDQYLGRDGLRAANGAGRVGSGFLWDLTGDDTYHATGAGLAANGGGMLGVGTLLDGGGDDRYEADIEFGATNGAAIAGVGTLIDASEPGKPGNDHYLSTFTVAPSHLNAEFVAANGAGLLAGMGFLLDSGGNDVYHATSGTTGSINGASSLHGTGWLLDASGDDHYLGNITADGAANGGARTGQGHLLDLAGNDRYNVSLGSGVTNGGGLAGQGLLVDGAGNDTYQAAMTGHGVANGGADRGVGTLIDGGGNDAYTLATGGPGYGNAGASVGAAILVDLGGNDHYNGSIEGFGSLNGSSQFSGVACLLDIDGVDHYDGSIEGAGGINGGSRNGVSLLVDLRGDDTYLGKLGNVGGINGAAAVGVAILDDRAGTNVFGGVAPQGQVQGSAASQPLIQEPLENDGDLPVQAPRAVEGVPPTVIDPNEPLAPANGAPPSLGILLGGPGNDTYVAEHSGQAAGDFYGIGILADAGGHNHYTLKAGIGQGAGQSFGTGILMDRGVQTTFKLDSATGQGAGLQGTGLLWRPESTSRTDYDAAPGSQPSAISGGGLGVLLDGTISTATGVEPEFSCPGPVWRDITATPGERLILCAPSPATAHPIRDPLTGEPLEPLPTRGQQCTGNCRSIVEWMSGPTGPEWIERDGIDMTTGGGVKRVAGRGLDTNVTLIVGVTFDRSCAMTCYMAGIQHCVAQGEKQTVMCIVRHPPPTITPCDPMLAKFLATDPPTCGVFGRL